MICVMNQRGQGDISERIARSNSNVILHLDFLKSTRFRLNITFCARQPIFCQSWNRPGVVQVINNKSMSFGIDDFVKIKIDKYCVECKIINLWINLQGCRRQPALDDSKQLCCSECFFAFRPTSKHIKLGHGCQPHKFHHYIRNTFPKVQSTTIKKSSDLITSFQVVHKTPHQVVALGALNLVEGKQRICHSLPQLSGPLQ